MENRWMLYETKFKLANNSCVKQIWNHMPYETKGESYVDMTYRNMKEIWN